MSAKNLFAVTRRKMIDFVLGGGVLVFIGTLVYPIFRFLLPSKLAATRVDNVRVAKATEIKPNSGKHFRFGSQIGILIRTPSEEFRAFDATCTHLSCTVQYRDDIEHIWCACHNGHFDLTGRNIKGPPPKPLPQYEVTMRGDDIFVSRKA
jgi:Rieske Fe-S protein